MTRQHILVPLVIAFGLSLACGEEAGEDNRFLRALPDESVVTIDVPAAAATRQGLVHSETGQTTSALVGAPADFYTSTYYQARAINLFGRGVLAILDAITTYPATSMTEDMAVWGPFRDDLEPNELRLTVQSKTHPVTHYTWILQGRHLSGSEFATLATGAFQPAGEDLGQGWFVVDFDRIHALNPAEEGRGVVRYAFAKTAEGVAVRVLATNDAASAAPLAYAFGQSTEGFGYILFAFTENIDGDPSARTAEEDLVVRTRWLADGRGRSDVLATHGDIGAGFVQVSQCWDQTFVSRYESLVANGVLVSEEGRAAACVFDGAWPAAEDLPHEDDIANPFED